MLNETKLGIIKTDFSSNTQTIMRFSLLNTRVKFETTPLSVKHNPEYVPSLIKCFSHPFEHLNSMPHFIEISTAFSFAVQSSIIIMI